MGFKKKILIFFISALVIAGAAAFLFIRYPDRFGKEPIFIAVTGPISGKHGEDMLKGIRLYFRHADRSENRPVELIIRDDKNDAAEAARIAAEIAEDKRVLAIIGRYSGSAYNSVTPIYKKYGIPVVTASSIITETEAQNEWYFSVVPDIAFQGSFIANYAVGMLKYTSVCIIHENNLYGTSLSKSFEATAGRLGIPIHRKWSFKSGDSSVQCEQIIEELLSLQDRGIVFIAAGSTESAKLVSQLKSRIPELPIIGSNSFTEETFISELKKSNPENTSDIYAVSYFMPDIAGETSYRFRKSFARVWHEEASAEAACYYDAAHTLIEAIHNAGIQGKGYIRGDRKKVREALAGFYQMENSIGGVTGDIYFDSRGSTQKSLFVVRYENNGFVPAFSQYKKMAERDTIGNIFEKTLKGSNILIQGILMNEVRVVRTGIRVNTITESSENEYTVDADLWFRFKGQFDNPDIEFTHSIHPIEMGTPIREYTADGITTRIYHIKAIFRTIPDYHAYPLDKQLLTIGFRHRTETRDQLIFISDPASSAEIFGKPDASSLLPDFGKKWKTGEMSFYTDVITNFSTLGSPKFFNTSHTIVYSRCNAEISAKRNDLGLIFKVFAPFVLIFICLFLIRFIPPQKFHLRLSGLLMIFIVAIIFHLRFFHEVPAESLLNADYVFFSVFALIILTILISIRSYHRFQNTISQSRQ